MTNPFESIEARLRNIESLLVDIKVPSQPASQQDPELLDSSEACQLLRCSKRTLRAYELDSSNPIKAMRIGRRKLYKRSAILKALETGSRKLVA